MGKVSFLSFLCAMTMASSGDDLFPKVLLGLFILFWSSKLGGHLAVRWGQPAVLGEIFAGIFLGQGAHVWEELVFVSQSEIFKIFAELGVVLLLFEVGLESRLQDLIRVGKSSLRVAIIGIFVPFILGSAITYQLLYEESWHLPVFFGAALAATSVGVTARVFKDLGYLKALEARIVLGAAVIDDILGLILLAVISRLVVDPHPQGSSGEVMLQVFWLLVTSVLFLVGALFLGRQLAGRLFAYGSRLRIKGVLVSLSLSLCFVMAYLAHYMGLAPIVGAFAAGLAVGESGYAKHFSPNEKSVEELIFPVGKFFVPIFFLHIGMQTDITAFLDPWVLILGLVLSLAAVLGKMVCGLGLKGVNPWVIGIGMVPRGEVGLIFAALGAQTGLLDSKLYAALIIMVLVTTMLTPSLLKWSLSSMKKPE